MRYVCYLVRRGDEGGLDPLLLRLGLVDGELVDPHRVLGIARVVAPAVISNGERRR